MNDKNPTIVIINGANWIGSKLIDTLMENQANVIVVDNFDDISMPFIKHFSDNKRFVFIEKDKFNSIRDNFTRIKYFIHLKNDFNSKDDDISSKQFLKETKFVDEALSTALEKNSAYILVSSIHLHKDFVLRKNFTRTSVNAYTESDLQDYIERTVLEYHHKAGLNSRVARLGNVYGPEMDLSKDSLLLQIISDAFYKEEVRIYGDGLEYMYYIFISDAIQGIFRALFTENTQGEVYSLTNPEEISILSIVNKVLSLQPNAKRIKFLKGDPNANPLYERAYIPDPNLSEIGWTPIMTFERGLVQLYEYFQNYICRYGQYDDQNKYSDNNKFSGNDNVQFDFDNTLNLADSLYNYNQPHESQQFRDFYKKLNADDSPIYNINNRENLDPHPYLTQKEKKENIFFTGIKYSFLIVLCIFIIIPAFRILYISYIFDNQSSIFSDKLKISTYSQQVKSDDFQKSLEESLIGSDWIINISKQDQLKKDYIQLLKAYNQSVKIYNFIAQKGLQNALNTSDPIDEQTLGELRNLLPEVENTIKDIQIYRGLNLPNPTKSDFSQILEWLQKVRSQINFKTLAN